MSKSKKTTTKADGDAESKILEFNLVKAESLTLRPRTRTGIYLHILQAIKGLKKGEAAVVEVPAGTDYSIFVNRLTSSIRNSKIEPAAGCYFAKRQTIDGKMAVLLLSKKDK